MKQILLTMLLLLGAGNVNAQVWTVQRSDSAKQTEYRENIGIDMTVADFETKKIDEKVMATRLADILNYLMDNYNQGFYERQLAMMLGKQEESLKNLYFNIKKVKFLRATKQGGNIIAHLNVKPDKNTANVKQAELVILLKDGVSYNQSANDLYSRMNHYVQKREKI